MNLERHLLKSIASQGCGAWDVPWFIFFKQETQERRWCSCKAWESENILYRFQCGSEWLKTRSTQIRDRCASLFSPAESEFRLSSVFGLCFPSVDWMMPLTLGRAICLAHLHIQILISPRNLLTVSPRTSFSPAICISCGPIKFNTIILHWFLHPLYFL